MQSSTGQYSTQAGEPAQPVQFSLIMARMCGLRLRLLFWPSDFGSYFTTSPATYSSLLGAVSLPIRPWLADRPHCHSGESTHTRGGRTTRNLLFCYAIYSC